MTDDRTFVLEFVAVQLFVVAAMIHVLVSFEGWLPYLANGDLLPWGVRYPLLVFSGIALLGGVAYTHTRENRRPFYTAGIVVMAGYAVGYFLWHLLGHRRYILIGPGAGTEQPSVQWFLDHLLVEATAAEFGAIVVEVTAILVLAALLYVTREDDTS